MACPSQDNLYALLLEVWVETWTGLRRGRGGYAHLITVTPVPTK